MRQESCRAGVWLIFDVSQEDRVAHTYKRRKLEEAQQLALSAAKTEAAKHLSASEREEFNTKGSVNCGSVGDGWATVTGFEPDTKMFYEICLYLPSNSCPWIEKYFARILVSRDRSSEAVWIMWKPPVPAYDGPYFE